MTPARASVLLTVIVAVVLGGACTRADPPLAFDQSRLTIESDRHFAAALIELEVDQALNALFERIANDPGVGAAGERLMGSLGTEPALDAVVERMSGKIGGLPATGRLVADLMASHPGITPAQLGELAGTKLAEAVEPAIDAAMREVVERPELDRMFDEFGRRFARNPHVVAAIAGAMQQPGLRETWTRRVRALAGGKVPDRERATDLIVEHAFSVRRCIRFYVAVLSQPGLSTRLAEGVRAMLATPSFRGHVVHLLTTLASDPAFEREAMATMEALLEHAASGGHDPAAVAARVKALLGTPATTRALSAFIAAILADPALAAIGNQAVEAIMADPQIQASIDELLGGW